MTTETQAAPPPVPFSYDRGPTIPWYTANKRKLLTQLPGAMSALAMKFQIIQEAHTVSITRDQIAGAWLSQPEPFRERSALRSVTLIPPRFYDRDSKPGAIVKTDDPARAFSPTAFMSEYADDCKVDGVSFSLLKLYTIPVDDPDVGLIISTEVVLHGSCHNIIDEDYFCAGHALLQFPDGTLWEPQDVDRKVRELEREYGPFSHYAKSYWKDGKFPERGVDLRQAAHEALCEYASACALGFVYCDDRDGLRPFAGREEIWKFTQNYLNARRVERTLGR